MMRMVVAIAAPMLCSVAAMAQLAPALIFADHMVLQQGQTLPLWGTAAPGAAVTVSARR